jgi:hypothetical protein
MKFIEELLNLSIPDSCNVLTHLRNTAGSGSFSQLCSLNYENETRILLTCVEYNELVMLYLRDIPSLKCGIKSNLGLAIKSFGLLNDCHTITHSALEII